MIENSSLAIYTSKRPHMYYHRVIYVVLLCHYFCFGCPLYEAKEEKESAHLTSKRSLETRLWNVLSPLDAEMASKKEDRHSPKYGGIEKVPQDLGDEERDEIVHESSTQGEKRFTAYPFSDYLFWLRSGECPQREEGVAEYFCPTPDKHTGRWSCVNDIQLCDQMRDCPNGEDEAPLQCLFYHVIQAHVTKLTQSLIWNARERGF